MLKFGAWTAIILFEFFQYSNCKINHFNIFSVIAFASLPSYEIIGMSDPGFPHFILKINYKVKLKGDNFLPGELCLIVADQLPCIPAH